MLESIIHFHNLAGIYSNAQKLRGGAVFQTGEESHWRQLNNTLLPDGDLLFGSEIKSLLAHPDFLANELAKGGKSAQRAQLCIDSGFAPAEALPKA